MKDYKMAEEKKKYTGKNGKVYDASEMYQIVRELLQNEELPEDELRVFMKSEMFLEVCPDLYEAFNSKETPEKSANIVQKATTSGNKEELKVKKEDKQHSKKKHDDKKDETKEKSSKPKAEAVPEKQQVKKESKENNLPLQKPKKLFLVSSSDCGSDSDTKNKRVKKKELTKKKKKRAVSGSSSGESLPDIHSNNKASDKKLIKTKDVKKPEDSKHTEKAKEAESAPKVHPFYLGKMGAVVQTKGKLFQTSEERELEKEKERELERRRRRQQQQQEEANRKKLLARQPKPYSYYSKSASKTDNNKNWKLHEESEFKKMQKKHNLKALSVVCVDLLKIDTIFHHSSKTASTSSSIPLKRRMNIPEEKEEEILKVEKVKRISFKPLLNKLYAKGLKNNRRVSREIHSSSDSSDPEVPKNRSHKPTLQRPKVAKEKFNARRGTAEWKKEQRQNELDRIRAKAEQKISARGTRKLPWEETAYFERKKDVNNAMTQKEKDNKKRLEERFKISKKNAPAVSFQSILQQIATANQEAAKKPPVELKIPKLSERPNEYKRPVGNIKIGDVANEVAKLLQSQSKVDVPIMAGDTTDLAEYTIRKIAWWFLKSEKDPSDEVLIHPELHDNELKEPWYESGDSDSDVGSIGCVSDPEGIAKSQMKNLPEKPMDPDVADEFCGLQSLEAKIRRPGSEPGPNRNEKDLMKAFFKVRPGTNYEKPNFEAKCFLCDDKVVGQRDLGAHIRSESHKNHFRNFSLKLASYEEKSVPVEYKKLYSARLVEYTVDNPSPVIITTDVVDAAIAANGSVKQEFQQIDSPMAIIDDKNDSPEIVQVKNLPLDELSLPSIGNYDLEPNEEQRQAKIVLRTAGKWTKEMENQWVKMKEEEARITEDYNIEREQYIQAPVSHPLQEKEWFKFWERRCSELEAEGRDPDNYNFASEWEHFWLKRMQEIMKEDVEAKILKAQRDLGLDLESLRALIRRYGLKLESSTEKSDIKVEERRALDQLPSNVKPEIAQLSKKSEATKANNIKTPFSHSKTETSKNNITSDKPKISDIQNKMIGLSKDKTPVNDKKFSSSSDNHKSNYNSVSKNSAPPDRKKEHSGKEIKKERPAINNSSRDNKLSSSNVAPETRVKEEKLELSIVKKPPVAPPPPKLSQLNKDNNDKSNSHHRRDSRDRRHDHHDKDRRPRHDRDLLDEIRDRDNKPRNRERTRDRTRSPPHKRRDEKSKEDPRREREEEKSSKTRPRSDSPSETDCLEPPSKIPKLEIVENKSQFKPGILSLDILDINAIEFKNLSETEKEKQVDPDAEKINKDLASALEELREAMAFAEPIVAHVDMLNSSDETITKNKVKDDIPEPRHKEVLPIKSNLLNVLETNTENILDIDNLPPISPQASELMGFDPFGSASPINTSVVMEEAEEETVSKDKDSVTESLYMSKPKTSKSISKDPRSSPEDGELGSSASSVSMGVNLNQISSFMESEIPGMDNLSGFGDKAKHKSKHKGDKKSPSKSKPMLLSPTNMDKNSLGYHLLLKQRKYQGQIDQISEIERPKSGDSHAKKFRNEVDLLEQTNPIGHVEKRRKSKSSSESLDKWSRKHRGERDGKKHREKMHNSQPSSAAPWNSHSNSRNSAPGPKCSKPNWSKPLPPPPPPPIDQDWMDESWDTEIPLPPPPTPPEISKPQSMANIVPVRPVKNPIDWDEENWEDEAETVTPASVAHPKEDWADNGSWTGNNNPNSNSIKNKNVEEDAPYSPTWDESADDAAGPSTLNSFGSPGNRNTVGTSQPNFFDRKAQNDRRRQRGRKNRNKNVNNPAHSNTVQTPGNYIPPLFSSNPIAAGTYGNNNYQTPYQMNPSFPNPVDPSWNNHQGFQFPNLQNNQNYSNSQLQPQSYPPHQYPFDANNYYNNY